MQIYEKYMKKTYHINLKYIIKIKLHITNLKHNKTLFLQHFSNHSLTFTLSNLVKDNP